MAHRQDVLLVLASSKSSYSCRPWVAICKGGRPRWIGTAPNCAARSPTTATSCDHAIDPGCFRNQNWRRTGSSHTFQPDQKEEAKLLITPRLAVAAKGKYCCTSSSKELSPFFRWRVVLCQQASPWIRRQRLRPNRKRARNVKLFGLEWVCVLYNERPKSK